MIDTQRRKKLSVHLRHFVSGQISNEEFEERLVDDVSYGWLPEQYYRSEEAQKDDPVIRPILEMAWCLYDDTKIHYLRGKDAMSKSELKEMAKCILFLQSEQEYTWSYVDVIHPIIRFSFKDFLKCIYTFGRHYRGAKRKKEVEFEEMKKEGDFHLWPFKSKKAYEQQLLHPPFLKGI